MSTHLMARVGGERFAFSLRGVREALDAPPLHDPPRLPDGMVGTLHYRGQTLAVWDAGRAFGIRRDGGPGTALVLDDAGHQLALLVDDAVDLMEIAPEAVRAAPAGTDADGVLDGVVRDALGLVGVVRLDVLVGRLVTRGARRQHEHG